MSDEPHGDATTNDVPDSEVDQMDDDGYDEPLIAEPPHPINWNLLSADDAEVEWLELNRWVDWLRHTYGLPASVIPPAWHMHPELLWELSALHLHWLCAYDPEQNGSAPLGWHRDFAEALTNPDPAIALAVSLVPRPVDFADAANHSHRHHQRTSADARWPLHPARHARFCPPRHLARQRGQALAPDEESRPTGHDPDRTVSHRPARTFPWNKTGVTATLRSDRILYKVEQTGRDVRRICQPPLPRRAHSRALS